jgi:RPA43 OB domain in RNA Pol I
LTNLGGIVALSSPDHVALISHALFNISIPRTELPEEWSFNDDTWYSADGAKIEGELEFEVLQYGPRLRRLTIDW